MIIIEDKISVSGQNNYPNEDIIFTYKNYYFLLDGATGLSECKIKNFVSEGEWFVHKFATAFISCYDTNISFEVLLEKTLFLLCMEYETLVETELLKAYAYPSAGMIVVEELVDNRIAVYRLGDCSIYRKKDNGKALFLKSKIEMLDDIVIEKIKEFQSSGCIFKDVQKKIRPLLLKHRSMMNTALGYWVLSANKSHIKKIVQNMEKRHLKVKCGDKLLLTSDGYSRIIDKYDYLNIFSQTLGNTINIIRSIENMDQECRLFPRLKMSDDSSALLMSIK